MNLQAIKLSAPTFEMITQRADDTTQQAKPLPTKKVSTVKEKKQIKRVETTKQIPLKKIEIAQVKPLLAPKEEVIKTEQEEPVETEENKENIEAEALVTKERESVLAQEQSKEVASASTQKNTAVKLACDKQYIEDNIALINALIKQNLYYPRIAKKRGMQGKAMVSFTLDTDGKILEIKALGSIASILSKAAIKTIQKASASFPHPKQVLALQIPIVYKLNQR